MITLNGETEAKAIAASFSHEIKGKTFLITGASNNSLGAEVALSLATAAPKALILLGRSRTKVNSVISQLSEIDPSIIVTFVQADFLDNASIRKAGAEINSLSATINSVIFSAGVMAIREFQLSKDGIEAQFAANYVGHFLLANLILDKLAKSSTFVTVTSAGYELSEVHFDDYNFQQGKEYDPWIAYGQATTAKILLAHALAKQPGVAAYSVHPGLVPGTALTANNDVDQEIFIKGFQLATERNGGVPPPAPAVRTVQQGAATILLAAVDPSLRCKSLINSCQLLY
jgi:NAD(P)-dependent dehydrogenase (short-subunit alcohol dehydrogenase family)